MMAGCSIRLSTPPRLSASVNSVHAFEEALGAGEIALEDHGDDAAERCHLPLGQRVLRMAFKPGIDHALDIVPRFQPARDLQRVAAMPLHAQRERLQAAQREEAVERPGDGADGVLQEAQPLGQRSRCRRPRRSRRRCRNGR